MVVNEVVNEVKYIGLYYLIIFVWYYFVSIFILLLSFFKTRVIPLF